MSIHDSEYRFIDEERVKIFPDFTTLFWPGRERERFRLPGGTLYWLKFIRELDKSVYNLFSSVIAPPDAYTGKGPPNTKQENGRPDDSSRTRSTRS